MQAGVLLTHVFSLLHAITAAFNEIRDSWKERKHGSESKGPMITDEDYQ